MTIIDPLSASFAFSQSMSSLQKKSATFTSKADEMDRISTAARNDYLLSLAMANAHQKEFYNKQVSLIVVPKSSGNRGYGLSGLPEIGGAVFTTQNGSLMF